MSRKADLKILVGTNGTGKSTVLKKYLQVNERNIIIPSGRDDIAWRGIPELKWRMVLVPDPLNPGKQMKRVVVDQLNTFTGNRVFHVDGNTLLFDAITDQVHGFRNGGLVLDDFRNYVFSKGTLSSGTSGVFINRRHKMLDIYMACHGFEDVSRDLVRFDPTLIIFRTSLPPNDASLAKMANGAAFIDTVRRVNSKATANPYYCEAFRAAL